MVFKTTYMLPNAADFYGLGAQRKGHQNIEVFIISFFKNYFYVTFLLSDFPSVLCYLSTPLPAGVPDRV